ncbi:MAG: hypothetical protein NT023_08695 [Armatimonadetes bacterium]|nr:hypothetical protein [Armatimonadota bacterium]
MKRTFKSASIWLSGLFTLTCLCALSLSPVYAQNDDGFAVSEDDTTSQRFSLRTIRPFNALREENRLLQKTLKPLFGWREYAI